MNETKLVKQTCHICKGTGKDHEWLKKINQVFPTLKYSVPNCITCVGVGSFNTEVKECK